MLITAMRRSNMPKFLLDDAVLFNAIVSDLFPGMDVPDHVSLHTLAASIHAFMALYSWVSSAVRLALHVQDTGLVFATSMRSCCQCG